MLYTDVARCQGRCCDTNYEFVPFLSTIKQTHLQKVLKDKSNISSSPSQYNFLNRDTKSANILYLSRSIHTCVKKYFGKSRITTFYLYKSKKVMAPKSKNTDISTAVSVHSWPCIMIIIWRLLKLLLLSSCVSHFLLQSQHTVKCKWLSVPHFGLFTSLRRASADNPVNGHFKFGMKIKCLFWKCKEWKVEILVLKCKT